jgi:hypothetical protein
MAVMLINPRFIYDFKIFSDISSNKLWSYEVLKCVVHAHWLVIQKIISKEKNARYNHNFHNNSNSSSSVRQM